MPLLRRRVLHHEDVMPNDQDFESGVVFGLSDAPMEGMTDNLLDIPAIAERLGVGERHIRRLVFERRIPFIKWGHLIRFDVTDIDRWVDEARLPAVAPPSYPGSTSPVRADRALRSR